VDLWNGQVGNPVPGAVDDEEPERERERADCRGGGEDTSQRPAALVVAGRAAREVPRSVQAAQDRERAEQQHEQRAERDEQTEGDAACEVVGPRAEPQASERNRTRAEQAENRDRCEQEAGKRVIRS
jgi:hypothetical protein